jgi:hypothetical protein
MVEESGRYRTFFQSNSVEAAVLVSLAINERFLLFGTILTQSQYQCCRAAL